MVIPEIGVGDTPLLEVQFLKADGTALDISTATTKEIKIEGPRVPALVKTAAFRTDGSDGWIQYQVDAADISAHGPWEYYGMVILADGRQFHALPGIPFKARAVS